MCVHVVCERAWQAGAANAPNRSASRVWQAEVRRRIAWFTRVPEPDLYRGELCGTLRLPWDTVLAAGGW